jgi:cytochrome c-type biogenesis protein CcmH/NrfG
MSTPGSAEGEPPARKHTVAATPKMPYIYVFMQKDKVILLVIVSLLAGFIAGAWAGIRFAAKEHVHGATADVPSPAPGSKVSTGEEIKNLESALRGDPNNLQILISLGNAYFDAHQHQKAIDAYTRALTIDPKNADVRTDMAIMYRSLKDYDRAAKELREAASQDPKHINSRYNLGVVLLNDKKDIKGAIGAWEEYLKAGATGEQAEIVRQKLKELKDIVK